MIYGWGKGVRQVWGGGVRAKGGLAIGCFGK